MGLEIYRMHTHRELASSSSACRWILAYVRCDYASYGVRAGYGVLISEAPVNGAYALDMRA